MTAPYHRNVEMAEKYGNLWGRAKVSDEQVRQIRTLYGRGDVSQQALAKQFGISRGHIAKIIGARVWKELR
jgi:hypothetical protein